MTVKLRNNLAYILIVLSLVLCSITPVVAVTPSVDAGVDSTVYSRNRSLFLYGSVNDNGAVRDSLKWTTLSGPGTVNFGAPDLEGGSIKFPDTNGTFVFELRAYYGAQSYADQVSFSVKFALPKIISPAEGAVVPVGKPLTIRWRFEPRVSAVQIDSSLSGGKSFSYLAGPVNAPESTCVWDVPDSLALGDTIRLKVFEYQNKSNNAEVMIILGIPSQPPVKKKSGCGAGVGLALFPPLGFRIMARRRRKVFYKSNGQDNKV